jgi:KamA family protein
LPVVIPARIDEELLSLLEGLRLRVYLVLHANHAQELGPELSASADRLRRCGVVLLNQSVLLRGVNDDLEALVDLSRGLIDRGILPYYLHLLDPVQGAAHFEVPAVRGQELVEAMRARLPGYGVPLLVREVPGAPAKLPV